MPSTRSSTRQNSGAESNGSTTAAAGTKRKGGAATTAPPGRKQQKTIDETIRVNKSEKDVDMGDDSDEVGRDVQEDTAAAKSDRHGDIETTKGSAEAVKEETTKGGQNDNNGSAVVKDPKREDVVPSNILEKGLIYFFFRGRVDINEPHGVQDVARSYIVLRPIPLGARLGNGPAVDASKNRLLALPKKVLPRSHRDKFMAFVEKWDSSLKDLKEDFLHGSEYTTKTAGIRHKPAATPSGEGVYALTSTGRDTHLAYILTRPSELEEVQRELGLRERGSFLASAKNPEAGGPPNTTLSKPAQFSKEIMQEFRGRAWMPLEPKLLDFDNCQILLIGEGEGAIEKASQAGANGEHQKETPLEEMEKLEREDEVRVEHLKDDDPVFADLDISSKEYSGLQTTW
ncbi:MAG: hypothetical protein M1832_005568 [Thelocarpon impressellum]|nr:MAG: hypothetical protein M1832_005568 [Thelocarpon impressellum]